MWDDRASEIEQAIDEAMLEECGTGGPGAGVAVVRDGRIVHAKGYGLANIEWNQPVSPTTLFAIGSLTKQITAVAVCVLHEEGKLDLDAGLTDVLSDYAGANGEATLRQLLHHTSGIADYSRHLTQLGFGREIQLSELLTLIRSLPADFEPGERYRYGNSGYVLLGAVIERASGVGYGDFMRSRVLEPVGMHDTCLLLDGPVRRHRASSYLYDDNGVVSNAPPMSMTWPHAAGALGSTLEDLVRWDQALRSHSLLSPTTSELMHRPAHLNNGDEYPYGFGIGLGSYLGYRCTHHAGGIAGFVSQIRSLYDPNLTVTLLANYRTAPFDRLTRKLARLALGLVDTTREPLALSRTRLDELTGSYVEAAHNQRVRVEREGENLGVTWTQGQHRQLIPSEDDKFFEADDPEVEWWFKGGRLEHRTPSWPPIVYSRLTGSG